MPQKYHECVIHKFLFTQKSTQCRPKFLKGSTCTFVSSQLPRTIIIDYYAFELLIVAPFFRRYVSFWSHNSIHKSYCPEFLRMQYCYPCINNNHYSSIYFLKSQYDFSQKVKHFYDFIFYHFL